MKKAVHKYSSEEVRGWIALTTAYIPTVSLLVGQARFRTICPAVPLSVYLSRYCAKIFSLNNDLINIKSSIFYLLFIVNIFQKVHMAICLSNIILLSLITSITIILSQ